MCSINQWQLQWHFIDFYLSHHIHQWKLDINRLLLLYEIFDICSSHRTIATPHHPPSMDYHPTIIEHATQLCRTRRENCQLPGKVLFPEVPSMEQIHHHFLLPSPLLPHPQTPVTPPQSSSTQLPQLVEATPRRDPWPSLRPLPSEEIGGRECFHNSEYKSYFDYFYRWELSTGWQNLTNKEEFSEWMKYVDLSPSSFPNLSLGYKWYLELTESENDDAEFREVFVHHFWTFITHHTSCFGRPGFTTPGQFENLKVYITNSSISALKTVYHPVDHARFESEIVCLECTFLLHFQRYVSCWYNDFIIFF